MWLGRVAEGKNRFKKFAKKPSKRTLNLVSKVKASNWKELNLSTSTSSKNRDRHES